MNKLKQIGLLMGVFLILITGCRQEDTEIIPGPDESGLTSGTNVADLIQRTSINDGSNDNILDRANCFNIKFPVTVVANGMTITVNSESDYDLVEAIFDASDTDTDTLGINFPITVVKDDYTEVIVSGQSEFDILADQCNGENEDDDDIECIDFQYPINLSIFNTVTEQTSRIEINSDRELHDFIRDLDNSDIANIEFPITVVLSDGSTFSTNNLDELEDAIEDAQDDCDEDDDYDYNDDDCVNCTPSQLTSFLTACSDWFVDKLEINNNDLEGNYLGYTFNFASDGTISVLENGNSFSGTWSASGTGDNITVIINITGLPDFNTNWTLHEIEDVSGEKKVDLRQSNDDRLRFESTCN